MLRRQSLIALGIAVVLGLVAVYLANIFLSASEQRADVAQQGMTRVAVAAVPLDYAAEITPDKIKFVSFPSASVPPGAFKSVQELLPPGEKRMALRPMQINEPILASKINGPGQNVSIAALLPEGKRAAAVRIDDVSGVAGFVQPNDSVDVLITRQSLSTGTNQQVTDVLLQNIRVIAMDQKAENADGKPNLARTATLEVDPLEAQKLALGQQVGTLSLVLRKPGEENNLAVVETVSLTDLRYSLYGGTPYRPAAGTAPRPRATVVRTTSRAPVRRTTSPPPAPRPVTNNVQVVRGTEGSNYEVGRYGS